MGGGPIFVSYARADTSWVRPLVEELRRDHVVFFDVYEIASGDSIPRKIQQAIENAELGLVFRSPVADQRPWLVTERAALQSAGAKILDVQPCTSSEQLKLLVDQQLDSSHVGPRPFVLAAKQDEESARKLERALGAEYLVDAVAGLAAMATAIGQERPLIVLWSAAARADAGLNQLLERVLMAEIPRGQSHILVWRLDPSPAHVLLASAAEARTEDEVFARLSARGQRSRVFRPVPRPRLAAEHAELLRRQHRLLLLGPRRGGVRTLAREVVEKAGFGESVTWLSPPTAPGCPEALFYQWLTRGSADATTVGSPIEYAQWQLARAKGRAHLIVLMHDGGDEEHFASLAATLRGMVEDEPHLSILTAGEARAAALRFNTMESSLFSGIPVRRVPDLEASEVRDVLKHAESEEHAFGAWLATGGHPGLLKELVNEPGGLSQDEATQRLARSPQILGVLRSRLREDSTHGRKKSHAGEVLRALLEGQPVQPLEAIQEDLLRPEVRLYYDGLVRSDRKGETAFRCEAVRIAAETALRLWEQESAL